jgi:uroporphyrinogen-III synthase
VKLPLQGRSIVVTRPRAQAAVLERLIAAQGGVPVLVPLIEIGPADDAQPLQMAIAQLERYALAIFISPNAVDFSVPAILAQRAWPPGLAVAAVGPGSVAALAAHGLGPVIAPSERFDSEALLALPELQAERVGGRPVAILRGDGGRELLADTLRQRGAAVDCISCYRRSLPAAGVSRLSALWAAHALDALTISSSEGLHNLVARLDAADREQLRATPIFVPHRRIAEAASGLGLRRVILTGAADAGIIAGLCAYNWQQS